MDETLFYGWADGAVFPLVQRTQQNIRVQLHWKQSLSPEDESCRYPTSQGSTTRIVCVHTSAECKPHTNIRGSYLIQASDIRLSSYNSIHLTPLFLCYWGWLCKFLSKLCFHTDVITCFALIDHLDVDTVPSRGKLQCRLAWLRPCSQSPPWLWPLTFAPVDARAM